MSARLRDGLLAATAELVACTVVAFVFASASEGWLIRIGRPLRWTMLGCLLGAAVLLVLVSGVRRLRIRSALAIAAGLGGLALVSAAWSVDPRLTVQRALSFALLLVTGAALATADTGRGEVTRSVLGGVLAGTTAVALGSLVLLAVRHDEAVQAADVQSPTRFRGLTVNPNALGMLLAVGIVLALLLLLERRGLAARLLGAGLALLFAGEIVATGSRGAMLAALAGAVVLLVGATTGRVRLLSVGAALVVFVAAVGIAQIPKSAQPPSRGGGSSSASSSHDAKVLSPLSSDIGAGGAPTRRHLLGSSGRSTAWAGALDLAGGRPVAGYGFGTEERVFVDRYYSFQSGLPENSYIGALLQLGAAGVVALLAAAALAALFYVRALRRPAGLERRLAVACAGCVAAGLVLGLTQSYLFSVGNLTTIPVWLAWFMLAARSAPA
ncbi:MAG: hypothetical protein QOE36_1317 [Gaiellaceae bacterium]|nr:hypothetical protein [Gaiellaceae bacterium]